MKKQINPTVKAHLIRGAFYLLLLVAVCAIPFALAQRNRPSLTRATAGKAPPTKAQIAAAKPAVAQNALPFDVRPAPFLPRTSQHPLRNAGPLSAHVIAAPPLPKAPQVVLYDQYNNGSAHATLSATFDDLATFSADLADDFIVPGDQTWNVQSIDADGLYFNGFGPATNWNVFIYADNAGLPGAQVYSILNTTVSVSGTTFTVNLVPAAVLTAGTYWIEIQANMDFGAQGEWGWTDRTVQSNSPAAWQNPGGGFGICPTWTDKLTCVPMAGGPDQVYRLNGTGGGGGTPTPTPTGTPGGCIVVNGDFETGSLPPWIDTGDTSFTGVGAPAIPHSGNFALFAGPSTSDGFIDQVLPTVAGQAYDVSFWLDNEDDSGNNRFGASFGGVTLVPEATQGAFGYTLFTFNNVIPGANADLHFIFFNQPTYFYLDDVCVTASGGGGSPTPTPTGTPGGCQVTGSIDTGDPTQIDRLFRSGFPQTCPASTSCAILGDGLPRHYDEYSFTNTTGATQCVTVDTNTACSGANFIFTGAYLGSYDPNNICNNWIGDSGFTPNPDQPFQVNVDDGQTFVVVVNEVTPDAGCPGYTVTITPNSICGGGGTPTPTPTATPTASPTATASATATPRPTPTPRSGPSPRPRPTPPPRP